MTNDDCGAPKSGLPSNRLESVAAWAVGGIAILGLPLSLYAHKGLAPLFALCALATFPYWITHRKQLGFTWIAISYSAMAILALVSGAWSLTPIVSLKTSLSFTATLAGAYMLVRFSLLASATSKQVIEKLCTYGGIVGFALLGIDLIPQEIAQRFHFDASITNAPDSGFWNARKPALSFAVLFIWPWAVVILRHVKRHMAIAAIAAAVIMLAFSDPDAPRAAVIGGLVVSALTLGFRRYAAPALATIVVLSVMFFPVAPQLLTSPLSPEARYENFSPSAIHRIHIWQVTAQRIAERPVLGHGFDTARALYGRDSRERITLLPGSQRAWRINSEPIPLHPHNLVLQVWLELGALGASSIAAFLALLVYSIRRWSSDEFTTAAMYGTFTSVLLLSNVSFGAWQAWWISAIAMIATLMASTIGSSRPAAG